VAVCLGSPAGHIRCNWGIAVVSGPVLDCAGLCQPVPSPSRCRP